MTALWSFDEQPRTGDPLLPGAAPAAIRAALLADDRSAFDAAYQRALAAAREDFDLTELFRCLEHWRRIALLQRDPDRFASVTTAVPVTVWLLKNPSDTRDDDVLFIDARKLGSMISRTQRDLLSDDIRLISDAVLEWRDCRNRKRYGGHQGFSASVAIQKIREHDYQLAPGRYVGTGTTTGVSAGSVVELRRELDRLHRRAMEVDAIADRKLDRIAPWIP